MDTTTLIDHLAVDGVALAEAAAAAGWDAPVPTLDWTVREVVVHLGGVHRWAADIVRTGADSLDAPSAKAVGSGPADDELIDWYRTGHADLVVALGEAPVDLVAATFLRADSPLHFWARRQAHETAIHGVDVAGAAGVPASFDADFAQDGLAELLCGFARRRQRNPPPDAVLGLVASDGPCWLVRQDGERVGAVVVDEVGSADSCVSGASSELYRWLWNRPAEVAVEGDPAFVGWWRGNVRVGW